MKLLEYCLKEKKYAKYDDAGIMKNKDDSYTPIYINQGLECEIQNEKMFIIFEKVNMDFFDKVVWPLSEKLNKDPNAQEKIINYLNNDKSHKKTYHINKSNSLFILKN